MAMTVFIKYSVRWEYELSKEIVQAYLYPHMGLLLKERICSLGEHILSCKSIPEFPNYKALLQIRVNITVGSYKGSIQGILV